MRVLTYLHSFELGGVERIALRLIRQWRRLGAEAPLYVGRLDGAMASDEGRGMALVPGRRAPAGAARWETLWMIATLPAVIRRERPDVLFCAGNTYAVVAAAMKILLGRECPVIVAKVSNDLDRRDKPWLGRHCYRLWLRVASRYLDHVVGMAEPARAEIRERLRVSDEQITIIPDPALSLAMIDAARSRSRPNAGASEGRRFVSIGRLAPQKNIALMLRAFQRGSRPGDHLTIIGEGAEQARLVALAARLGIESQVTFRGYVACPIEVLHEFDVLLLSSNYEGVPAVILEALAANLTIVATDCSRSMSALLERARLGELAPVGDEKALADAIARARPGSSCGELSRAQAERFTLEHAAELYLVTFAEAARKSLARSAARRAASAPPPGVVRPAGR